MRRTKESKIGLRTLMVSSSKDQVVNKLVGPGNMDNASYGNLNLDVDFDDLDDEEFEPTRKQEDRFGKLHGLKDILQVLDQGLDEVESDEEDQGLNINNQIRNPPKITQSQIDDQLRADKIKQLTGGVLMTESKLQPNYVQNKGQSLLHQADSLKKKENIRRFKDLDELNKVSSEQEQLIYQQKLEIKALKEDLNQSFKDLAEKDIIIKRLESRATTLTSDQDDFLKKMKKLEGKNETFKTTNMELRKKLQDLDRISKGNP